MRSWPVWKWLVLMMAGYAVVVVGMVWLIVTYGHPVSFSKSGGDDFFMDFMLPHIILTLPSSP